MFSPYACASHSAPHLVQFVKGRDALGALHRVEDGLKRRLRECLAPEARAVRGEVRVGGGAEGPGRHAVFWGFRFGVGYSYRAFCMV
jgi:hypothetical protein